MEMREQVQTAFEALCIRCPALRSVQDSVSDALALLSTCYHGGGKLLTVGNGGSAADAEHIVGELMKGFCLPRKLDAAAQADLRSVDAALGTALAEGLQGALPAISLCGHPALFTAIQNDLGGQFCFAQQVLGLGRPGDVLMAISTSGRSENILYAAVTARACGMKVVGLTGAAESRLSALADVCIRVPATETYLVQELHESVYHFLCRMLEAEFFEGDQG